MSFNNRILGVATSFLLFLPVSQVPVAHAAEIDAALRLGYGHSDNIERNQAGDTSDEIGLAGFIFNLDETSRRTTAEIRSAFDYTKYKNGTYDNSWNGGAQANIDFSLVEDRIFWVIEENYGQILADPLANPDPDNRENINIFATGPSFILPFGSRNLAGLDLRYVDVRYETNPFDNSGYDTRVWIGREIRNDTVISLNVGKTKIDYSDNSVAPDYDIYRAFVRYEGNTARSNILLDIGTTRIDINGEEADGFLLIGSWNRAVTPSSSFQLTGGTEYSNQGNLFRILRDAGGDVRDVENLQAIDSPFRANSLVALYDITRARTQVAFSVGGIQEEYEINAVLNRDVTLANFFLSRDVTRSLYFALGLRYQENDYVNDSRKDQDLVANGTFGYRFSAATELALTYSYSQRDSTDGQNTYDENRVMLILSYRPSWGRSELN